MPHQALLVLAVAPDERRLRVRATLSDPEGNPPLDRSFFVRMFVTLAEQVGGNASIDAALPRENPRNAAFVDPNAWRFVSGYVELPDSGPVEFDYDVTVVDSTWLAGLSPGLACVDSADYSSGADPVTSEEALIVPDIRRGEVLAPFDDRFFGSVAISSDGTLLALMPGPGGEVAVFETDSLREVLRCPAPGAYECVFVPGSSTLVFDLEIPGVDARSGRAVERAEAIPGWPAIGVPWLSASADGHVRVIEEPSTRDLLLTDGVGTSTRRLGAGAKPRLSRDGSRLIALRQDTLAIWGTRAEAEPRILPLRDESHGLAISPDGDFAITMEGRYRHVYVRRLADGERVRFGASWHDRGPFEPFSPMWSPDGSFALVCYRAREVGGRGRAEICRREGSVGSVHSSLAGRNG